MLFPPLGLAALTAHLRGLGVETKVFDGTFGSSEQLVRELTAYAPCIVGISSMVSLMRNTVRIAEAVRMDLPDALLVAGGYDIVALTCPQKRGNSSLCTGDYARVEARPASTRAVAPAAFPRTAVQEPAPHGRLHRHPSAWRVVAAPTARQRRRSSSLEARPIG